LRALSAASKAGLIPSQAGANSDRFVLKTGEELSRSLQTQEFGRPLALGAVLQDAVERKELVPLAEFLNAKKSIYAKTWIPTPWQAVSWGLKQLGVMGGESVEDKLIAGNFVVMANVEVRQNNTLFYATVLTGFRPPQTLYWTRRQGSQPPTHLAFSQKSYLLPHSHPRSAWIH
jgi:charged multivesicular body protein 7